MRLLYNVLSLLFLFIILILVSLNNINAISIDRCNLPFEIDDYKEYTDIAQSMYTEYHNNGYTEKWAEYAQVLFDATGGSKKIIGFYDFDTQWAIVYYTNLNEFFIIMGDNWKYDNDYRLSTPSCVISIGLKYFQEMQDYYITWNYFLFLEYGDQKYNNILY